MIQPKANWPVRRCPLPPPPCPVALTSCHGAARQVIREGKESGGWSTGRAEQSQLHSPREWGHTGIPQPGFRHPQIRAGHMHGHSRSHSQEGVHLTEGPSQLGAEVHPLGKGAGQGQAGHLDPCPAGWGSQLDFSPSVETRKWEGAQPVLQGGELPFRHQPRRQTPTGSSTLKDWDARHACQEKVQFIDTATR